QPLPLFCVELLHFNMGVIVRLCPSRDHGENDRLTTRQDLRVFVCKLLLFCIEGRDKLFSSAAIGDSMDRAWVLLGEVDVTIRTPVPAAPHVDVGEQNRCSPAKCY